MQNKSSNQLSVQTANMNITSQTASQVRNDETVTKFTESALARREEEAAEKRRMLKKRTVEIDVSQAMQNTADQRIGNYSAQRPDHRETGTVAAFTETESPSQQRASISNLSKKKRGSKLQNKKDSTSLKKEHYSSTHTLSEQNRGASQETPMGKAPTSNGLNADLTESFIKLQTKENPVFQMPHNSKKSPMGSRKKGKEVARKSPSIIDLSLVAPQKSLSKQSSSPTRGNKATSKLLKPSQGGSSGSKILPNLDLIEQVSRASQQLTHELLNSHTGFAQRTQRGASFGSEDAEEVASWSQSQPSGNKETILGGPPGGTNLQFGATVDQSGFAAAAQQIRTMPSAISQNTTIGFHRGSKAAMLIETQKESGLQNESNQNKEQRSSGVELVPSLSNIPTQPGHARLTTLRGGQANPPVSDEQRYKSDRTGISKNSFERASKNYYLHQQKMLQKDAKLQLEAQRQEAAKQKSLQASRKLSETDDVDQLGSQMIPRDEEIVHDQVQLQTGQRVIVKRQASKDNSDSAGNDSLNMTNLRLYLMCVLLSEQRFQTMVVFDQKSQMNQTTSMIEPTPLGEGSQDQSPSQTSERVASDQGLQISPPKALMNKTGTISPKKNGSPLRGVSGMDRSSPLRGGQARKEHSSTSRSKYSISKSRVESYQKGNKQPMFFSTQRNSPVPSHTQGGKGAGNVFPSAQQNQLAPHMKDSVDTQQFEQSAMVIGRPANIVPIMSKMKRPSPMGHSPVSVAHPGAQGHIKVTNRSFLDHHNTSQQSFKLSPRNIGERGSGIDHDANNSSVKTFDSPAVRLPPRPLNYVYQIQQEREDMALNTATSGNASIAVNEKGPIKAQYSTDEQIDEEKNLEGTLRMTNSALQGYGDLTSKTESPMIKGGAHNHREETNQMPFKALAPQLNSEQSRSGGVQGGGIIVRDTNVFQQSRSKIQMVPLRNRIAGGQDNHTLSNQAMSRANQNSRFSNVMTLKPPSPTPPNDPQPLDISETLAPAESRGQSADAGAFANFGQTHNPNHRIIIESSDDNSTTHFIELPNNPYLAEPNYSEKVDLKITKDEELVRQRDPETFLYLMLLKKMKHNPSAQVTKETRHEFVEQEKGDEYGAIKPLLYKKKTSMDNEENFKQAGVIPEESFQFDEMKRRRSEYANYCIQKIKAAIKDETMNEKDQQKSPLNVQIASSKRRDNKRQVLKEQLATNYGITFQDNRMASLRLTHGLSSVRLEDKIAERANSGFGIKTEAELKKFEELNGFKLGLTEESPGVAGSLNPFDVDNLNEQSQILDKTGAELPKLSYTSWNVKDLQSQFEDQQSTSPHMIAHSTKRLEPASPGATNFNFQTKKRLKAIQTNNQIGTQIAGGIQQNIAQKTSGLKMPLSQMLNINSGELSQASLHMTAPNKGFYSPDPNHVPAQLDQTQLAQKTSRVFKARHPSLTLQSGSNELELVDAQGSDMNGGKSGVAFGMRKSSHPVSIGGSIIGGPFSARGRNTGVKDYFSTFQRFDQAFATTGNKFLRQEIVKHKNPKFIEIIAKLRDPSLNADFMEKSVIRPTLIEAPKAKKLDQKMVDVHLKQNSDNNNGCPLLPVHKMDPIYQNKMQDVLHELSDRPKERSWQQIGVMLPILRQNATKNVIRNGHLDIDPSQEAMNQAKIVSTTLHSPAQLSSPNIHKQYKQVKRGVRVQAEADSYEHRIKVKDIVAVKVQNEKEILRMRQKKKRMAKQKQALLDSERSEILKGKLDYIAEQMAMDDLMASGQSAI